MIFEDQNEMEIIFGNLVIWDKGFLCDNYNFL